MSDNSVSVSLFNGLFWPLVFVLLFVTGNCGKCGGDRDYVGEYVDNCRDGTTK
jgi:hypothetical protein